MDYNFTDIEKRWQQWWKEQEIYKVSNESTKPKYYVLDMFPYPSGEGLHVGHPLGYIASDIVARYKRQKGFNVLHPMGYDSFGLPAEQYAIDTGQHPKKTTDENIIRFRQQLENIGFCYDWSRQVKTSDPGYYKWTQTIFLKLFNHYYCNDANKAKPIEDLVKLFEKNGNQNVNAANGSAENFTAAEWNAKSEKDQRATLMDYRLAYLAYADVNWCEALGTVLANDEVKDGVSERGGHPVIRKSMKQWFLRITAYADRLLNGLNEVGFSSAMKAMQENWIGRSEGAEINFEVAGNPFITVFTTRPDTIFGATYMVLAPEHELVNDLATAEQKQAVEDYKVYVSKRSERDRLTDVNTITGAFTGSYAINPITKKEIPIWISEYVLAGYGTGAIMAVPSDDDRDNKFAKHFDLPIIEIIDKSAHPNASRQDKVGTMINSEFLNGMEVKNAINKILNVVEEEGIGKRQINFKMRDAGFSRQRYWGEPFPIVFKDDVAYALKEEDLPVNLPEVDNFDPTGTMEGPLSKNKEWVNEVEGYRRETDTMPGYAGSSWYYLRYMDPTNEKEFASKEAMNYWGQVDLYVGGAEHAVGHLLYSRLWNKFLKDLGYHNNEEPYKKLINQGMIGGYIEYIYLMKEKKNGKHHFICSKLVEAKDENSYVKIPVKVSYIENYGSEDSYMSINGIENFIKWRPEYKDAIFECGQGSFESGKFIATANADNSHLITETQNGKMSKRYHNTVDPNDVVKEYGADTLRLYEMFLGPLEMAKPWDTKGIDGTSRFLRKLWRLFYDADGNSLVNENEPTDAEQKVIHGAIKKVSTDIERFSFNTCVSHFMVAVNELTDAKCNKKAILKQLVALMAAYTPHICEELWQKALGQQGSVVDAEFPKLEEKYLVESAKEYPIQINGKVRTNISFPLDMPKDEIEAAVLKDETVLKWTEGNPPRKVIVVPGRIVNIVV